jgi:hypothetical protein
VLRGRLPAHLRRLEGGAATACVVGLLLWTTWLQLLVSLRLPQWDSDIWLLMGRWWLDGIWPYRDAWELKPPGIFLYMAGIFALLPHALWSVRVVDWLVACGSMVAAFLFLRRQVGLLPACLGAGAWSYYSIHNYFVWGSIFTEQYAAAAMWMACWLASAGRPVAAGAAVAAAALFKHPAATVVLPAVWFLGIRRVPWLLLGTAAVVLPILAGAWLVPDMWERFVECNWSALFYHGQLGATSAVWTNRVGQLWSQLVGLAARFPIASLTVLAGVGAAPAVAVLVAQRLFATHHFVLALPSAIWIASSALRRPLIAGIAVLMLAAWLPGLWREWSPQTHKAWALWTGGNWPVFIGRPFEDEVGGYVRARTEPSDRIAVLGWNATELAIYWSAERLPAIRHFYGLCCGVTAGVLLAEVHQTQPAAVVLINVPEGSMQQQLEARYRFDRRFHADYAVEVWLRRSEGDADTNELCAPEVPLCRISNADSRSTGGPVPATP